MAHRQSLPRNRFSGKPLESALTGGLHSGARVVANCSRSPDLIERKSHREVARAVDTIDWR